VAGIRSAEESGQHQRLRLVQAVGPLPEQHVGDGTHSLQLAGERDEVEVGLEDLWLAPARLDGPGHPHLSRLLGQRPWAAVTAKGRIEERGQLHGDRARAASAPAHQPLNRRGGHGASVHSAMRVEAPILRRQHRRQERGRDVAEPDPFEAPAPSIHPLLVDHLAAPVEEIDLGGLPSPPHAVEVRRLRDPCVDAKPEGRGHDHERESRGDGEPRPHGFTSNGWLGNSPKTSGA